MDGEFSKVAVQIARVASEEGVTVAQIASILLNEHGEEVNCYPGSPSNKCHQLAYFISLESKLRKGGGHYKFEDILQALIKHVQGSCMNRTGHAVIITDFWSAWSYEKWRDNIESIKNSGVCIEAYLIGFGGWASRIDI